MTSPHVVRARRNLAVGTATAALVGLLFLYPTSTDRAEGQRRTASAAAPAGIVTQVPSPSSGPHGSRTARSTHTARTAAPTVLVNGTSVDTRYGPVQVQITVRAGRIVAATAVDYPKDNDRSQAINRQAVPVLQRETIAAQSARIDTVSGATYTSDGYRHSLQAAIDAAHLG